MILEFDIGNTSVKWRCLDGSAQPCSAGRVSDISEQSLTPIAAFAGTVERVRVSSVAAVAAERNLDSWSRRVLGVGPEFARTSAACAGVRNSYQDPSRMGVDRWLAMLAAYHRTSGPSMIVDAGSALTIDWLDADGLHEGGYIIPGMALMRRALLADTERVRFDETDAGNAIAPGRSTAEAVLNGARLAICGSVNLALQLAGPRQLFLTGGDAAVVAELLPALSESKSLIVPDLVMDGLALALP